jgi:hypothetical protein
MANHRADRDIQRGRRAAAAIRAGGGSALEAAYAHIEATFSPAMRHSTFKERVGTLVRGLAGASEARTRYRRPAERHPISNLEAAIVLIERLRYAELEARATAIRTWGHCSRPRLGLMMLDELRLILRLVRRHAPARYPELVAMVLDSGGPEMPRSNTTAEAAE